jgi:hypothetical protein
VKVESQVPPFGEIDVPGVETFVIIGGDVRILSVPYDEIAALLRDPDCPPFVEWTVDGKPFIVRTASIDAAWVR